MLLIAHLPIFMKGSAANGCQKPHMPVSMGDALVKHLALIALAESALLVLAAATWQIAVC